MTAPACHHHAALLAWFVLDFMVISTVLLILLIDGICTDIWAIRFIAIVIIASEIILTVLQMYYLTPRCGEAKS